MKNKKEKAKNESLKYETKVDMSNSFKELLKMNEEIIRILRK